MFPLFGTAVASHAYMGSILIANLVLGEVSGDAVVQTIIAFVPIVVLIAVLYLLVRRLKSPGGRPMTEAEKNKWSARRARGKIPFIVVWGLGFALYWGSAMLLIDYFHPLDRHAQPHGFEGSVGREVLSTTIGALFFGFFMSRVTWLSQERCYRLPTLTDDSALVARRRRVQLQIVIVVIVGVVLIAIAAFLRR